MHSSISHNCGPWKEKSAEKQKRAKSPSKEDLPTCKNSMSVAFKRLSKITSCYHHFKIHTYWQWLELVYIVVPGDEKFLQKIKRNEIKYYKSPMVYVFLFFCNKRSKVSMIYANKICLRVKNCFSMPMFVRDAWIESWSWLCVVLHADYWNQLPVNGSDLRPKNLDFSMVLNCVWNVPMCQCPTEVPLAIGSAYIQRKCLCPMKVTWAKGSDLGQRKCP